MSDILAPPAHARRRRGGSTGKRRGPQRGSIGEPTKTTEGSSLTSHTEGSAMRTHLHTTLNKSRDERTETAGEGRGTRRGDPAALDVWSSDWLSVAKILRIPGGLVRSRSGLAKCYHLGGTVVPLFGGLKPTWYHQFGGTHPGIEPSRVKNGTESQSLNQTHGARG